MSDAADPERLLLLALVMTGRAAVGVRARDIAGELEEAGWVSRRGRSVEIVPAHAVDVEARLDRVAPGWRDDRSRLNSAAARPNRDGLRAVRERRRHETAGPFEMSGPIHRKVYAARFAAHSKVRVKAPPGRVLTVDDCVRIRPHSGMTVNLGGRELNVDDLAGSLGELIIPERALLRGLTWTGPRPAVALAVENLGPYVDVPQQPSMAVVYVPGFNTRLGAAALRWLAPRRIVHFGDLDPSGFAVWRRLCRWFGDVEWLVPDFWSEHLAERSRRCEWPQITMPLPPIVEELTRQGRWLEQELLIGDPRLDLAVRALMPVDEPLAP